MLNKWDEKKESIFTEIHAGIEWKIEDSKEGSAVKVELTFAPEKGSAIKGEFPGISYEYKDRDEFDRISNEHYTMTARFFTMVAVDEDILLEYEEDHSGFLKTQRTTLWPTAPERTTPFRRFGRLKFSGGKMTFVSGPIDGFYEKLQHGPRGCESVKVSWLL